MKKTLPATLHLSFTGLNGMAVIVALSGGEITRSRGVKNEKGFYIEGWRCNYGNPPLLK
jgi:hypothetical protein